MKSRGVSTNWRITFALTIGLFIVFVGCFNISKAIAAGQVIDWNQGTPFYHASNESLENKQCVDEKRIVKPIANRTYLGGENTPINVCVYYADGWSYAQYTRSFYPTGSPYLGATESGTAVVRGDGSGNMEPMYMSGIAGTSVPPLYLGGRKEFVYLSTPPSYSGAELRIFNHPMQKLVTGDYDVQKIDTAHPDFIYQEPNGRPIPIFGLAASSNGRWLVFSVANVGVMRLDMDTREVKRVGEGFVRNNFFSPLSISAISDDGRHIVTGGTMLSLRVIEVSDTCGEEGTVDYTQTIQPLINRCQQTDLDALVEPYVNKISGGYPYYQDILISPDGGEVQFYDGHKWATVTAPGYSPPLKINYLALGDSYSSGEGDIDWQGLTRVNHYQAGTNTAGDYVRGMPEEKCHISNRSYPFLLANDMGMGANNTMKSIACSGAVRLDVQGWDTNSNNPDWHYMGQTNASGTARLMGIKNANLLQMQALDNFSPGRVQQVEMVKKHKPKVVTMTLGGNDVGFGHILKGCIMSLNIPGSVGCSDASMEGRALMAYSIRDQYAALRDVYQSIRKASPGTKLYVAGYPQFISDTKMGCWDTLFTLNSSERHFIKESVTYINEVISAAASEAGAIYIDIADSLGSGKICETSSNMVDLTDYLTAEQQEIFHPNAAGHAAIHRTISDGLNGSTLLNSAICNAVVVCPDGRTSSMQPYFSEAIKYATYQMALLNIMKETSDTVVDGIKASGEAVVKTARKGAEYVIELNQQELLMSNAAYSAELHSTPTPLGSGLTSGTGTLRLAVKIPTSIPIGEHTVHLLAISKSGQPIDYVQRITVLGPNGDIDDDGVLDANDTCQFTARGSGSLCDVMSIGSSSNDSIRTDRDTYDDAVDGVASHDRQYTFGSQYAAMTDDLKPKFASAVNPGVVGMRFGDSIWLVILSVVVGLVCLLYVRITRRN